MEPDAGLRDSPGSSRILDSARARGRRSLAPHHRRRRAVALLALLLAALAATVLLTGGSHLVPPAAHPPREVRTTPSSLHAREAMAENAAIDRTLAYTPYVRIAGTQHREVALTFDDGPGPYTPQILSVLQRYKVPATFFEVGVMERYFSASTAQIAAAGDAIGDHTEAHVSMSKLPAAQQRSQLLEQAAAIESHGAPFPRLFRPPDGLWNARTLALLRRYQMLMVLWTVDTGDYRRPGAKAIVRAAVKGARPGAIILFHDAGGNRSETVAALPRIIAKLRRRHFRLVTVPKLLLDNPAPRDQQISMVIGKGG